MRLLVKASAICQSKDNMLYFSSKPNVTCFVLISPDTMVSVGCEGGNSLKPQARISLNYRAKEYFSLAPKLLRASRFSSRKYHSSRNLSVVTWRVFLPGWSVDLVHGSLLPICPLDLKVTLLLHVLGIVRLARGLVGQEIRQVNARTTSDTKGHY
jgi:hypothetical protein